MRGNRATAKKDAEKLKSVVKALQILEAFTIDAPELSVADLEEKLSIPKVSIYRFLRILTKRGFVRQDLSSRKYSLGIKVFELGSIVLRNFELRKAAFPLIDDLSKASGETVHLGVLDGLQVVSIEGVESDQSLRISVPIGKRVCLHSTGIGKAILAFLPENELDAIIKNVTLPAFTANTIVDREALVREIQEIRISGYSVDNEENELGIRCVAAPLFDADARVVASISISGPAFRIPTERIPELANMVIIAADSVSKALGYRKAALGSATNPGI
jgi:IclR family KDG regulon transcriptional repressor